MDNAPLRFYPELGTPPAMPLARYLPPLPPGSVSAWLAEHAAPGSWLLDPLGSSPALALEAARAGYRVLVASNNPITSFLLETLASAPKSADFQSVLAVLASTRRGEERLEVHIKNLYLTDCATCGEQVQAQAFLWRKGEEQPFARLYRCPKCGDSGEQPVTQADLDRLAAMGGDKLQRARALQRVIPDEDEHRADVAEAMECYLPRSLYVLFTLINKLEGLGLPPAQLRLLHALLIVALDSGNTLWPWPGGRSRPKQLTVPPQFRENNLWLALEEASDRWSVERWSNDGKTENGAATENARVPFTRWPDLPPQSGGICLFRGRVKALMPLPADIGPRAVVTAFPRPNQAFWTLSVLWAGWLWGPEAALPLRNVLDRRRYDWNWHTSAIHNALAAVGWSVPPETPFFALIPELAPGFLSAVVVAAEAAGFRLKSLALRPEQELAQGLWEPGAAPAAGGRERSRDSEPDLPGAEQLETAVREAMRADLIARAEPAPYLTEYSAGLAALVQAGAVPRSLNNNPGDLLTRVQAVLARTFASRSFLRLYGGQGEEERGAWWLHASQKPGDASPDTLPLADRVEIEVIRFLQKHPVFTFEELDQAICIQFKGLLTPPVELVHAILESYGEPLPSQSTGLKQRHWRARSSESAAGRRADLQEAHGMLEEIGQRLSYSAAERGSALVWQTQKDEWWFYPMASSIISRFVLAGPPGPPRRCVLVIPGSRARLLTYKLRRDPRLEEAARGWRILKFRHLREIAANLRESGTTELDPSVWESLLEEDPLTEEAVQMELFASGG